MQADSKNISVLINGESKFIPQYITIMELLELYKINKNNVVVELNRDLLKKDSFESTNIKENDKLEIITFVGGG